MNIKIWGSHLVNDKTKEQAEYISCQKHLGKDVFENIVLMPDAHYNEGVPVGFTALMKNGIVPKVVGSDIGCGLTMIKLKGKEKDYDWKAIHEKLYKDTLPDLVVKPWNEQIVDKFVRPLKFTVNTEDITRLINQHLTLGQGNHFVEVVKNTNTNELFVVVHSGSRGLGGLVYQHYLNVAKSYKHTLTKHIIESNKNKQTLSVELSYISENYNIEYTPLSPTLSKSYFEDMQIACAFASWNRLEIIKNAFPNENYEVVNETVHNYVYKHDGYYVVRKGAIASDFGDVLIPLNMKDGILHVKPTEITYNNSLPHGAGRVYSRKVAKEVISMDDFKKSMSDVVSYCVSEEYLDEAPQSYKDKDSILDILKSVAEVNLLKTIFNSKSFSSTPNKNKK